MVLRCRAYTKNLNHTSVYSHAPPPSPSSNMVLPVLAKAGDRFTAHVVPQFSVQAHGWGALLSVALAVEAAAQSVTPLQTLKPLLDFAVANITSMGGGWLWFFGGRGRYCWCQWL